MSYDWSRTRDQVQSAPKKSERGDPFWPAQLALAQINQGTEAWKAERGWPPRDSRVD